MKLPPPITPETFEKMVKRWLKVVHYKESASIYFYSKPGILRRLNQLLKDKRLLEKYLGKKTKIMVVNLELLPIEDREDLEEFLLEKKISQLAKDYQLAFFIVGADKILKEKRKDLLAVLEDLEMKNSQFSLLLFFNLDFTHPRFFSLLSDKSVFLQNIIIHPLYDQKDVRQFIFYLSKKWQVKVNKRLEDKIVKNCGGNFWLVKQAVRFLRDHSSGSGAQVFNHQEMRIKLKMIWDNFLGSEKRVIEKITSKQKDFLTEEKHSLRFLEKIKMVAKEKRIYQLTTPLLRKYVKQRLKGQLTVKNNLLYFKGVLIEKNFSQKEGAALKLLLKRKEKLVTRDEIAAALWGQSFEEKYSDWAIDQMISRVRKKLRFLGIDPSLIKTVRGKGFVLSAKTDEKW